MTRNQIEFQKLRETIRSNQAQEALITRRDEAAISAKQLEISESQRHNVAGESETVSHNRNVESETARHNKEVEQQALIDLGVKQQQADIARSNAESQRIQANVAQQNADTNRGNLGVSQYSADTQRIIALTGQASQTETARSNQAKEQETYRSNVAKETENVRSNVAKEKENVRTNKANEAIDSRSNLIKEKELPIKQQQADAASSNARTNKAVAETTISLNKARTSQTATQEQVTKAQNSRDWITTFGKVVDQLFGKNPTMVK